MSSPQPDQAQFQIVIDQLPDFIDELRGQGYRIGVQHYVTAKSLLLKLYALHSLPPSLTELATWLAPVFAATPEEQANFSSHFAAWLRQLFPQDLETSRSPQTLSAEPLQPVQERSRAKRPVTWTRYRIELIVTAIAAILTVTVLLLPRSNPAGGGNAGNGNTNQAAKPSPTISTKAPAKSMSTTLNKQVTQVDIQQFGYAFALVSEQSVVPPVTFEDSWYTRNFSRITRVALIVPLAIFGIWFGWNLYQRRLQLERWRSKHKPRLDRIPVEGVRSKLFHTGRFRRIARELRRHRRADSSQLAIKPTVESTTRRAGLFTPVYSNRRTLPEYLILIDRLGFRDQQASYLNEFVNRLIDNDVFVDRYYFQGDPHWCRQGGPDSPHRSLQDLAGRHPDHNLLIFSEGEGLISPLTGQPQAWLKLLSQWRTRALLTPVPTLDWGYREWALAHSDFMVVPATVRGMESLIESISTGGVAQKLRLDNSKPFPALLEDKPELWSQQDEPAQVNKLCAQLKRFLGEDGYYLLCACSVYPSLQWELTLYLAFHLLNEKQIEECIASLVRLPWLRQGFMPEWLRWKLISDLGPQREQVVRRQLQTLLLTYLKDPRRPVPLTYSSDQPDSHAGYVNSFGNRLWRRLIDWRNWRLLRRFVKGAPDRSLLHDDVFLKFMSRSKLAFPVPPSLRRYLVRSGRLELGLRSLPAFILSLLAVGVIWLILSLGRPVELIPPQLVGPIEPASTPNYKYTPVNGLSGATVPLIVTNMTTNRFDFTGTTLSAPDGSGLSIDGLASTSDQLMATLHIAGEAKPSEVKLTLLNPSKQPLAYLPFVIGAAPATVGARQIQVEFLIGGIPNGRFGFEINSRDLTTVASAYVIFVEPRTTVSVGQLPPGTYRLSLEGPWEFATGSTTGPSAGKTAVITIPPGANPFKVSVFIRQSNPCRFAPRLELRNPNTVREGEALDVSAAISIDDQSMSFREPFDWRVTDDRGQSVNFVRNRQSTAVISIDTTGLANRRITVNASLDLTSHGSPGCTQEIATRVFVAPASRSMHEAVDMGLITIKDAKQMLDSLGFFVGEINDDDTDEFRAGIREFQKYIGLPADSLLGPQTATRLKQFYASAGKSITSFTFLYVNDPKQTHVWTKVSESAWTEAYPDGSKAFIDVIGRLTVDGDPGTLLRNRPKPEYEYFIPDGGGKTMWLRIRLQGGPWSFLNQMQNIRYGKVK